MLSKEEIGIEHEKDSFCVRIPLITEQELKKIDDNLDSITDKFTKQIIKDKDLAIAQHIIQKQKDKIDQLEQENNKQAKIIDEMAEYLAIVRDCPNEDKGANIDCENRCSNDDNLYAECWKLYFERKVNKDE